MREKSFQSKGHSFNRKVWCVCVCMHMCDCGRGDGTLWNFGKKIVAWEMSGTEGCGSLKGSVSIC